MSFVKTLRNALTWTYFCFTFHTLSFQLPEMSLLFSFDFLRHTSKVLKSNKTFIFLQWVINGFCVTLTQRHPWFSFAIIREIEKKVYFATMSCCFWSTRWASAALLQPKHPNVKGAIDHEKYCVMFVFILTNDTGRFIADDPNDNLPPECVWLSEFVLNLKRNRTFPAMLL